MFKAKWFKGSLYGVFRRDFLQAALFSEHVAPIRDLLLQHDAVNNPDELFFSSLAFNPSLRMPGSCTRAPLPPEEADFGFVGRFVIWGYYGMRCSKYVRTVCILGNEHTDLLKKSPHLIANKFHSDFQPEAYDAMEAWYFDKMRAEISSGKVDPAFNTSVYATRSCSRQHN